MGEYGGGSSAEENIRPLARWGWKLESAPRDRGGTRGCGEGALEEPAELSPLLTGDRREEVNGSAGFPGGGRGS